MLNFKFDYQSRIFSVNQILNVRLNNIYIDCKIQVCTRIIISSRSYAYGFTVYIEKNSPTAAMIYRRTNLQNFPIVSFLRNFS